MEDPVGPLRRRELDVMAFDLPIEEPDIVVGPILRRDDRLIAVAENHPRANRDTVSIDDICGLRDPRPRRQPPRGFAGRMVATANAKRAPNPPAPLTSPAFSHIFALVAPGEIVHFATTPLFLTYPGIAYRPITDMPPIESALIWLASEETAAIRAFAEAAQETLGQLPRR